MSRASAPRNVKIGMGAFGVKKYLMRFREWRSLGFSAFRHKRKGRTPFLYLSGHRRRFPAWYWSGLTFRRRSPPKPGVAPNGMRIVTRKSALAWKPQSSRGKAELGDARLCSVQDMSEDIPRGMWTVYGHDTFAREDYLIAEFPTEAEAREFVRQREERLAKFQDEPLRDDVWVEPPGGGDRTGEPG